MSGPTLIQRQTELMAQLAPIYAERHRRGSMGGDLCGKRAKIKRLHAQAMQRHGYSHREAWASVNQADDMAQLEAGHAAFLEGMGVAA